MARILVTANVFPVISFGRTITSQERPSPRDIVADMLHGESRTESSSLESYMGWARA